MITLISISLNFLAHWRSCCLLAVITLRASYRERTLLWRRYFKRQLVALHSRVRRSRARMNWTRSRPSRSSSTRRRIYQRSRWCSLVGSSRASISRVSREIDGIASRCSERTFGDVPSLLASRSSRCAAEVLECSRRIHRYRSRCQHQSTNEPSSSRLSSRWAYGVMIDGRELCARAPYRCFDRSCIAKRSCKRSIARSTSGTRRRSSANIRTWWRSWHRTHTTTRYAMRCTIISRYTRERASEREPSSRDP